MLVNGHVIQVLLIFLKLIITKTIVSNLKRTQWCSNVVKGWSISLFQAVSWLWRPLWSSWHISIHLFLLSTKPCLLAKSKVRWSRRAQHSLLQAYKKDSKGITLCSETRKCCPTHEVMNNRGSFKQFGNIWYISNKTCGAASFMNF